MGRIEPAQCHVCDGPHDRELHAAALRVRSLFRDMVKRALGLFQSRLSAAVRRRPHSVHRTR
jgi:hypothetical protein